MRKVKKPAAGRREEFVTPEDWAKIRDSYKPGDPFRVFLEFCWETGARPQEAKRIEPRHVHLDRALIAIPPREAKGKKKWRLIRLEGRALEIVRGRMAGAAGTLFVNRAGRPWTTYAVNCRFCRLKEKLGAKFCNYQFRHGFTQRLLVGGGGPPDGRRRARPQQRPDGGHHVQPHGPGRRPPAGRAEAGVRTGVGG